MEQFIKKHLLKIIGAFVGMAGGYLYYFFIGCTSGTCPITSNPYISIVYGGVMGYLLFDLFKRKKKKMYSTFYISKSQCMTCNNEVLKQLGTLHGVFGAEMDRIDGKVEVNHTDEISREEIRMKLDELGWKEDSEPSVDGCVL